MVAMMTLLFSYAFLFQNWYGYGYTNKRRSYFARERKLMYEDLGIGFLLVCFLGGMIAIYQKTTLRDPFLVMLISFVATTATAASGYDSGKRKNASL